MHTPARPDPDTTPTPTADQPATTTVPPEVQAFTETLMHLPSYVKVAWRILRDGDINASLKARLGLAVVYTISPVDLVPGGIPVAGQIDDIYVLLLGLKHVLRRLPDDRRERMLAGTGVSARMIDDDLVVVRRLVRHGVVTAAKQGSRFVGRFAKRRTIDRVRIRHGRAGE